MGEKGYKPTILRPLLQQVPRYEISCLVLVFRLKSAMVHGEAIKQVISYRQFLPRISIYWRQELLI